MFSARGKEGRKEGEKEGGLEIELAGGSVSWACSFQGASGSSSEGV